MKYGLVVLVGVSACVPHPPHEPIVAVAPDVLRSQPLQVGQRATYVERDHGREVGRLYLAAFAVAECGTWVRAHVTNGRDWHTWMLCVRDDGTAPRQQLARAMLDDGEMHRIDVANLGEHRAEIETLLSRIVPPALGGRYAREDVTVDAGRFRKTLRVDNAGASTWLHPAVPFGGVVKIVDGRGREDALYDLGYPGEHVEQDLVRAAERSRHEGTYEIGYAYGWFSGTTRRSSGDGSGLFVSATWPASQHIDLLLHATALDSSDLDLGGVGLGARWSPLRRDRGFATNQVFLQATLGYAQLDDTSGAARNTLGRGGELAVGAGYSWMSRHDWTLTINLDHHLAYLNAGHGVTQSVSIGAGLQLAFP